MEAESATYCAWAASEANADAVTSDVAFDVERFCKERKEDEEVLKRACVMGTLAAIVVAVVLIQLKTSVSV